MLVFWKARQDGRICHYILLYCFLVEPLTTFIELITIIARRLRQIKKTIYVFWREVQFMYFGGKFAVDLSFDFYEWDSNAIRKCVTSCKQMKIAICNWCCKMSLNALEFSFCNVRRGVVRAFDSPWWPYWAGSGRPNHIKSHCIYKGFMSSIIKVSQVPQNLSLGRICRRRCKL